MLKNEVLMDEMFRVFENDDIPITQGGYLNKCIVPMIYRSPFEFWTYLDQHPKVLTNLLKHLDNINVVDILS